MLCIIDNVTDPYWNLAAEEYLLTTFDRPVFRLWRNEKAVIVGRYQNTYAEINRDFIRENGIPVIRRVSGGGAVFHDLGNILFTFADKRNPSEDTGVMFRNFTRPIIDALKNLGVDAYLEGRNDLLIDGRKFSGNAVACHGGRVLQHGTLLFSSSMADLSGALNSRPEKFAGKAVQSNRSRVTNISEHLHEKMDIDGFMRYLSDFIGRNGTMYSFTEKEKAEITSLRNSKYVTDRWNYGESPDFGYSNIRKFPSGLVEVYMNVSDGQIADISIKGDYFFMKDTSELESLLRGKVYERQSVEQALEGITMGDYISGLAAEDFIDLLFC